MLIKILIQAIFSIVPFILNVFPNMPDLNFQILPSITSYIRPFAYTFAFDQLLIVLLVLFSWLGIVGFLSLIHQFKILVKWW